MEDLVTRWHPLAELTSNGAVSQCARDLLGGIEPQDPANRRELLTLALLAVSVDRDRLREEFALRSFLGPGASLEALVNRQRHLTKETVGTANPLKTLGVLVSESLPNNLQSHIHRSKEPRWDPEGTWRSDAESVWLAAVRFGHLAQTIAQALALNDTVHFYRYLSANCANHPTILLPNDIACVNEPWRAGTDRVLSYAEGGSPVFEIEVPPAGIVAVAHSEPSRAHEEHPARFVGESGHPVVTVYPPLAHFAPQYYTGLQQLARWRQVTPSGLRNH